MAGSVGRGCPAAACAPSRSLDIQAGKSQTLETLYLPKQLLSFCRCRAVLRLHIHPLSDTVPHPGSVPQQTTPHLKAWTLPTPHCGRR